MTDERFDLQYICGDNARHYTESRDQLLLGEGDNGRKHWLALKIGHDFGGILRKMTSYTPASIAEGMLDHLRPVIDEDAARRTILRGIEHGARLSSRLRRHPVRFITAKPWRNFDALRNSEGRNMAGYMMLDLLVEYMTAVNKLLASSTAVPDDIRQVIQELRERMAEAAKAEDAYPETHNLWSALGRGDVCSELDGWWRLNRREHER